MFQKKYFLTIFLLFFVYVFLIPQSERNEIDILEKGKIISKIICTDDIEQSYALYLPSDYSNDKKWSVLYLFEPGARAMIPMKLFKEAAEKYKYILICSNNSKNGPPGPINRAIKAVWNDSRKRLSLDLKRVYTGGFSGGARVSSQFQFIIRNQCQGIIAFGAGLSTIIKPEYILHSDYFGAVGMADFNYREMTTLEGILNKAGVNNNLIVFDGGHRWPDKNICMTSIEWMEIRAMKRGFIKKDNIFIETFFRKYLDIASKHKIENKIYQAYRVFTAIEKLFAGLIDTSNIVEEKTKIKKEYERIIRDDKKYYKNELSILKNFYKVLYLLKNNKNDIAYRKTYNKIPYKKLQKIINSENDLYKKSMAKRLFLSIMDIAVRDGYKYMQEKEYRKAAVLFDISVKTGNKNPNLLYNLACSYAQSGSISKSIKTLEKAIENGFKDINLLKTDKDLKPVRKKKKAYNNLLKKLKQ